MFYILTLSLKIFYWILRHSSSVFFHYNNYKLLDMYLSFYRDIDFKKVKISC